MAAIRGFGGLEPCPTCHAPHDQLHDCSLGFDEFAKIVMANIDVFNFPMVFGVLSKRNCSTTITSYGSWKGVPYFHFI